ncbi:hypothetical protein I553_0559 [Mycobacterium xenopi 4042]|uniref:Uncharacterized protein n=1 Tax=Mycobacterium xenopi 4042 TaxID=1299334 RepID=X7YJQ0_MYCXE|nr:hypothetical protein I553_0559 [Mycobacterium xenopi 4042]
MFGSRPCPDVVVAGADTGIVRLPPSTLYMRVLALKASRLLLIAGFADSSLRLAIAAQHHDCPARVPGSMP